MELFREPFLYTTVLLRERRHFEQHEQDLRVSRGPMKRTSLRPTPELLKKYGGGPGAKDRGGRLMNDFFEKWYIPNFVDHNPKKGNWILWIWSKSSNVAKTWLWKHTLPEACNQPCQVVATEKAVWFQDFVQHGSTVFVIDGYEKADQEQGLNRKMFEAVGCGLEHPFPKRGLAVQPKSTRHECWLVTANNPMSHYFSKDDIREVLAARVQELQFSKTYPLFPIIDLLLELHGKPPHNKENDAVECVQNMAGDDEEL